MLYTRVHVTSPAITNMGCLFRLVWLLCTVHCLVLLARDDGPGPTIHAASLGLVFMGTITSLGSSLCGTCLRTWICQDATQVLIWVLSDIVCLTGCVAHLALTLPFSPCPLWSRLVYPGLAFSLLRCFHSIWCIRLYCEEVERSHLMEVTTADASFASQCGSAANSRGSSPYRRFNSPSMGPHPRERGSSLPEQLALSKGTDTQRTRRSALAISLLLCLSAYALFCFPLFWKISLDVR